MRLTAQTDYALRMLMHLAVNSDRWVTISEIAERFDISKNHLMKIAQTLVARKVVQSLRGRGGGLRLARPANAIHVGEIARPLEAASVLVECFPGGANECLITPSCKLKGVLREAQAAFYDVLDQYSIADLVGGNQGLEALLAEVAA
ncbi:MAG: DNA-binding protein [Hyphobacterium sp.]|nr:MAG: DNA-binding protein [Hyphobacterium sp.]